MEVQLNLAKVSAENLPVEARMRSWQGIGFSPFLDAKASRSGGSSQIGESIDGNGTRTGDKLKQPQPLLVGEAFNDMPIPDDDLMRVVIAAAILGVLSPIINIDFRSACNHELKLSSVEHRHETWIDDLIEATYE